MEEIKKTEQKKEEAFSTMLQTKLDGMGDALPKNFNKARFITNTFAILNSNPNLKNANKAQLLLCLTKGAMLDLDAYQGDFYIIPYADKVNFQTSYKGEIKLAIRYSEKRIKNIVCDVVREGDDFSVSIEDNKVKINFKQKAFNDNDIIGAFAYVVYEDESIDYATMSKTEINSVRSNYSKAQNSGAWKNSWGEMAKKTVIRRLLKRLTLNFENTEQAVAWEDGSDFTIKEKREKEGTEVPDIFDTEVKEVQNGEN